MATYPPPSQNSSVFNALFFTQQIDPNLEDFLNANYLKFPAGQGLQSLPDLVVAGLSTLGEASADYPDDGVFNARVPTTLWVKNNTSGGGGTANDLAGGTAGVLPYQAAASDTQFTAVGTAGQSLLSNGTSAPSWGTPASATRATSLAGGSAGLVPYQSASGTTAFTATAGTNGQVLTSTGGSTAPTWTTIAAGGTSITPETITITPVSTASSSTGIRNAYNLGAFQTWVIPNATNTLTQTAVGYIQFGTTTGASAANFASIDFALTLNNTISGLTAFISITGNIYASAFLATPQITSTASSVGYTLTLSGSGASNYWLILSTTQATSLSNSSCSFEIVSCGVSPNWYFLNPTIPAIPIPSALGITWYGSNVLSTATSNTYAVGNATGGVAMGKTGVQFLPKANGTWSASKPPGGLTQQFLFSIGSTFYLLATQASPAVSYIQVSTNGTSWLNYAIGAGSVLFTGFGAFCAGNGAAFGTATEASAGSGTNISIGRWKTSDYTTTWFGSSTTALKSTYAPLSCGTNNTNLLMLIYATGGTPIVATSADGNVWTSRNTTAIPSGVITSRTIGFLGTTWCVCATTATYTSTNNGVNWTATTGLPTFTSITSVSSQSLLYASNESGIWSSPNGTAWTQVSTNGRGLIFFNGASPTPYLYAIPPASNSTTLGSTAFYSV